MKLTLEQAQGLPFPVGCPVWFYLDFLEDGHKYSVGRSNNDQSSPVDNSDLYGEDIDNLIAGGGTSNNSREGGNVNGENGGIVKRGQSFSSGIIANVYMDFKSKGMIYQVSCTRKSQGKLYVLLGTCTTSNARDLLNEKLFYYHAANVCMVPHDGIGSYHQPALTFCGFQCVHSSELILLFFCIYFHLMNSSLHFYF